MPELPEVETVRCVLKKQILNKKIIEVEVIYPRIIANLTELEFKKALIGQTFIDVKRKGKYLIFILNHDFLISHLRMEGKYRFDVTNLDKHCHILIKFSKTDGLIYHDVRKFGRMYYFNENVKIEDVYPLNQLGLEPFDVEDASYLLERFKKKKKTLKESLLDQSILCGIGNIYADEICFQARLHPTTLARTLTFQQCNRILKASQEILTKAIQDGGSTIKTFQSVHGVDGKFQNELMVYGRAGLPCYRCGHTIEKMKIGGRGSAYCPVCQKKV